MGGEAVVNVLTHGEGREIVPACLGGRAGSGSGLGGRAPQPLRRSCPERLSHRELPRIKASNGEYLLTSPPTRVTGRGACGSHHTLGRQRSAGRGPAFRVAIVSPNPSPE